MVYLLESCVLKEPYSMKFNLQNMVIKSKDTTPYEVYYGTYRLKDYSYITIKYNEIIYQFLWDKTCIDIKDIGSYESIYSCFYRRRKICFGIIRVFNSYIPKRRKYNYFRTFLL